MVVINLYKKYQEKGAGAQNTAFIVAVCGEVGTAAVIADEYSFGGYHDWYLHSKDELSLLQQQRYVVGGFETNAYWSSTEFNAVSAWSQNIGNGSQYSIVKNEEYGVRAIRTF